MRSFLYASAQDTRIDDARELASWHGLPLTFQIMVSQGAHLVFPTIAGQPGIAIAGDFVAGRGRLLAFLEALRFRGLFDETQLRAAIAKVASTMFAIAPTPAYVTLELNGPPDHDLMQALITEVLDIEDLINQYLAEWATMKDDGQIDEMWGQLGIPHSTPGTASAATNTPPLALPRTYSNHASLPIQRPLGVTIVCALQIVFGVLSLVLSFVAFGSLSATNMPLPGVYAFVMFLVVGLTIADIVLVVFLLNGSLVARRIFAVVTVIGLVADLNRLFSGNVVSALINMVLSIVSLAVLYSGESNGYFDQTGHRLKATT